MDQLAALLKEQAELLDLAHDAILILDVAGRVTYWNHGAEALYGWSRDEATGQAAETLLATHPPVSREAIQESLLSAGRWEGEIVRTARSGAPIAVDSRWVLRRDDGGRPAGLIQVDRDITAHRRTAEAMRESEARHRSVMDNLNEGMVVQNATGEIVDASPAAERILGLTRDQMAGRTSVDPRWRSIHEDGSPFPGDTHPAMYSLRTGQPQHDVVMGVRTPDGRLRWIRVNSQPLFAQPGAGPHQVVTSFVDITALKQAELDLAQREARYRLLAENARDVIFRLRLLPDRAFEYVSAAVADMTGFTPDEIYADPETVLGGVPSGYQLLAQAEISDRFDWDRPIAAQFTRKDGAVIWIEQRLTPVLNAAGRLEAVEGVARDVTENKRIEAALQEDIASRKRAETALRESETRYRSLFDYSPFGIVHTRPSDGTILSVNPEACRMLGRTEEEVRRAGRNGLLDLSDPRLAAGMEERARSGMARSELTMLRGDGTLFPVEMASALFTSAGGEQQAIISFIDITERKQAEEALRESEARYRSLFENNLTAVMHIVLGGDILAANPEACRLLGRTEEEIRRLGRLGIMDPSDPRLPAAVEERRRTGRFRGELTYLHSDGTPFPVEVGSVQFTGQNGQQQVITSFVDITERKRADQALRESEARFSTVFRESLVAIAIRRLSDHRLVDVNPAWENLTGYARQEVIGHTPQELKLWADRAEFGRYETTLLANGVIRDYELRVRRKSGEVAVLLSSSHRVDIAGEPCILFMAMDITERKQIEAALRQSQKLEALSTLAAGIAHDFNNLLLAISGHARLAAHDLAPDHPAQESLAEIAKASTRAARLVRQILVFGSAPKQKHEITPLPPIVEESLALLRVTTPPAIRLQARFADSVPAISCSTTQVHQTIVNLVHNAVQAIASQAPRGAGGQIDVTVDDVMVDDALVRRIPSLRPGRYARLTVSDNGPGMGQDTLQRILEPFFTTRPLGQGAGLGLPVVYGIMREHGGAIDASSQPGQGATFQLYFPAAEAAAPAAPGEPAEARLGHGERVLIVDDEEALVLLLSRTLKTMGYAVTGCTDPLQALDVFRSQPNAFDVVVTDLSMPGLNGFDLAREMLAARPDLPIVMTTGYVRAEDQDRVTRAGIRELILKPDTIDEMGRALDRLFRDIRQPPPAG